MFEESIFPFDKTIIIDYNKRIIVHERIYKKAEDITIIDISEVSVLADYFIIADGSNRNQVQAMADSAEESLGKAGYDAKQIEGYQSANWILMDYKDIIVHVFSKEDRAFYDLERIWRDGKQITKEDLQ